MINVLTALLGVVAGASTAVAASCVWVVLLIPARLQDRVQAGSPRMQTLAMCLGMLFIALHDMLGFTLPLPGVYGIAGMLLGGMFVGMLSAALEEILEVAPVLMQRFHLGDASTGIRFVMMIGKGLGAILAALVFTTFD